MRYTCRKISDTLYMIRSRRANVGKVVPHAGGGWVGVINNHSHRAPDYASAFRGVAAKAFGYANADDLRAHNRAVRQQRNAGRNAMRNVSRNFARLSAEERAEALMRMIIGRQP